MLKIISADLSLDKDAFNQVRTELESKLKKIMIPVGRQFINLSFEDKPNYEAAASEVEELEEDYPYVTFVMSGLYNIYSISNLYEEFSALISETKHTSYAVQVNPLMGCPAYTRFITLLSTEVEKTLASTKAFINNKWKANCCAEVVFNNEEGDYQDELKIILHVYVKQG